jgi:hypothetical protein
MIRNLDQELSAEDNSKDCRKHERSYVATDFHGGKSMLFLAQKCSF